MGKLNQGVREEVVESGILCNGHLEGGSESEMMDASALRRFAIGERRSQKNWAVGEGRYLPISANSFCSPNN